MNDDRPTCATCIFWDRGSLAIDQEADGWGACHKQHAGKCGDASHPWGESRADGWCGEHPDFAEWGAAKRKKQ